MRANDIHVDVGRAFLLWCPPAARSAGAVKPMLHRAAIGTLVVLGELLADEGFVFGLVAVDSATLCISPSNMANPPVLNRCLAVAAKRV